GVSALEALIGDWSAAFWDAERLTLVLASDYTGVRPLYYCCSGDVVMWSGSLDELLSRLPAAPRLDEDYAAEFLACAGSSSRTPYASVLAVPPGTALRFTRRTTELIPIWRPRKETIAYRDERDYADQFRHLFEEAVAVRLETSGPVFAELSGGLDSSAIVCMAHNLIREGRVASPGLALVHYPHPDSPDAHFYRIVERELGLEATHLNTADYPFASAKTPGRSAPMWWEGRCHELARLLDAAGS